MKWALVTVSEQTISKDVWVPTESWDEDLGANVTQYILDRQQVQIPAGYIFNFIEYVDGVQYTCPWDCLPTLVDDSKNIGDIAS